MLAVFTIDSTADTGPGTLREAIDLANAAEGPDEIVFDSAVFSTPQTIALASTLPTVTEGLTITGPGRDLLAIDGRHGFDGLPGTSVGWHAFEIERPGGVDAFTFRVSDLTVQRFDGWVGAIDSDEPVSLDNVALRENYVGLSVRSDLTIHDSVVSDHFDGAVRHLGGSLSITASELAGNVGRSAVESLNSGPVTIDGSYFHRNVADGHGGALFVSRAESLSITRSTFASNEAGADGFRDGGALYVVLSGPSLIENVTFSGNSADNSAAIFASGNDSFRLSHSTVVDSVVPFTSSSAVRAEAAVIDHSVIARTGTPSAVVVGFQFDTVGYDVEMHPSIVITHSLIGRVEGGLVDREDGNRVGGMGPLLLLPRLGPLAMNGGPTPTHALLPGSLALDAGDPAYVADPGATDQRGEPYARVIGDAVDLGAYEAQGPVTRAPGDFNADGRFDAADYTVWRDSHGSIVAPLTAGDADGDGRVDDYDLASWSNRYGDLYFVGSELIVNDPGIVNDRDIHNGQTTLREAIEYLNANQGLSVIRFDPAMNGQTIDFTACPPVGFGCGGVGTAGGHVQVMTEITIDATDLPDGVTAKVNRNLFWVAPQFFASDFTLDLTIRRLNVEAIGGGGFIDSQSLGLITLDRVHAQFPVDPVQSSSGPARGVYSRGPITLIDSEFDGGGLYRFPYWSSIDSGVIASSRDVVLIRSEVRGSRGGASTLVESPPWNSGELPFLPTVTLIDSVITDTFGVPAINAEGNVELVGSRIENGAAGGVAANLTFSQAGEVGGNVVLTDSVVSGNGPLPARYVDNLFGELGAGIAAYGDVSLVRSRVENNNAGVNTGSRGGGVLTAGSLYAEDTHISGNTADLGGGVYVLDGFLYNDEDPGELDIAHPVTLVRTTLDGNRSRGGGAAVYSHGTIRFDEVTVTGNEFVVEAFEAERAGIVLLQDDEATSRIDILDSTLSENVAASPYSIATVAVTGLSPVEIVRTDILNNDTIGANATRIIDSRIADNEGVGVRALGSVSIEGTTVERNGGGVLAPSTFTNSTITITGSEVIDNISSMGFCRGFCPRIGGVLGGRVELNDTRVTGNQFEIFDFDVAGRSAGVTAGSLVATDSTIADNTLIDARTETPSFDPVRGGGILAGFAVLHRTTVSGNAAIGPGAQGGGVQSQATVELHQSTVSGNRVDGEGAEGGGVHARALTAIHSTLAANTATGAAAVGGGAFLRDDLSFDGVLLAGNTAAASPDLGGDLVGTVVMNHSLVGDTAGSGINATTGLGNLLDVDPLLGPLADNGGPTQTHALLAGSPAIDAGDPSRIAVPFSYIDSDGLTIAYAGLVDQRGDSFARVVDGGLLRLHGFGGDGRLVGQK